MPGMVTSRLSESCDVNKDCTLKVKDSAFKAKDRTFEELNRELDI